MYQGPREVGNNYTLTTLFTFILQTGVVAEDTIRLEAVSSGVSVLNLYTTKRFAYVADNLSKISRKTIDFDDQTKRAVQKAWEAADSTIPFEYDFDDCGKKIFFLRPYIQALSMRLSTSMGEIEMLV